DGRGEGDGLAPRARGGIVPGDVDRRERHRGAASGRGDAGRVGDCDRDVRHRHEVSQPARISCSYFFLTVQVPDSDSWVGPFTLHVPFAASPSNVAPRVTSTEGSGGQSEVRVMFAASDR